MTYGEFITEYGDQKVVFSSYYKYMLYFIGYPGMEEDEFDTLVIWVGGNAPDIYKLQVHVGEEYTVKDLEPSGATLNGKSLGYWYL